MSDYTPPTLVIPTPDGNPGDGTINGNLTFGSSTTGGVLHVVREGVNGTRIIIDGRNSQGTVAFGDVGTGDLTLEVFSAQELDLIINAINNHGWRFNTVQAGDLAYFLGNKWTLIGGVATQGLGYSPIYGLDNRTGLTAADSAAKTLYTTTAAGQLYRLMGRILATAGTSPSATYTIKWTEGGATITKTLTISALDSDSDLSILIQPDNGTAITAQLTAISGTGTTVNVAATIEQMA